MINEGGVYEHTDFKMHDYGVIGMTENGDIYRYAILAADVVAGMLLVADGRDSCHADIPLAADAAVGDTSVSITLGAGAIIADELDEGWLCFTDVSPEGEAYKIVSHPVSAGSEAATFYLDRPLVTAATTSSEVTLVKNPWNRPAVSQLIAERPAGVTVSDWDVSEAQYGWLKTKGTQPVLQDSTGTTVGYMCSISNQTNGAVGVHSDDDTEYVIGQLMQEGTATEFNPVYLMID